MADESSSIALQLSVNLRGLTKITQLNAGLKELKTNAIAVQRAVAGGATTLKNLGANASTAAKGIKDLAKSQDAASKSARKNDMLGKDIAKIQAQELAGARRLAAQKAALDRKAAADYAKTLAYRRAQYQRELAQELKDTQTLSGRIRAAEEANDAIFRAGFRLQMVGRDLQQVGKNILGVLGSMASEFGDFQFMVNRAAGAMSLTTDELDGQVNVYDRFQKAIFDTAQELRLFDPTEVAKATYFWASTTGQQVDTLADLQRVMKSVNPLMKVAAMTQTDYETSIKGVYSILTQYGLGLDDVQSVTEKLYNVTQATAAEFPDLINSFKMVGPVAAANNMTFDDMVVLLGRLADAGIRGSMSGRAFRQMFIQLNKPSALAKKALDDLWQTTQKFGGKSYVEMVFPKGQFVGVTKYVDMLATATADLTEHQRNALLAQITTANELPVLTALVVKQIQVQKGLSTQTEKTGDIAVDSAKRFDEAWQLLAKSWNGVVGGILRGVEIIRIQIGGRIAEVFAPALEQIQKGLEGVINWIADPRNKDVIDFFVKIAGFSGAFLAVAGSLMVLVGALTSAAAAAAVALKAFGPLLGKFTLMSGVIGAVFSALIRNFDYIKKVGQEALRNIQDALGDTQSGIEGLTSAFSDFSGSIAPIFDAFIHAIGQLILVMSQLIVWVSKNELAMDGLKVVAQILGAVVAVKLVKGFLGFFNILKSPALAGALKLFGGLVAPTSAWAGTLGVLPSRLGNIKAALGGLVKFLGPGGLFAVAAVGFELLYNNVDAFHDAIDGVFKSMDEEIRNIRAQTEELASEFGQYSADVDKMLRNDPAYAAAEANLESLRQKMAQFDTTDIFSGLEESQVRKQLGEAEAAFEGFKRDSYQTIKDWVDELNQAGSDINVKEFLQQVRIEQAKGAKTWDEARQNAWLYFKTLSEGQKAAEQSANDLIATIERTPKPAPGKEDSNYIAGLKQQLVNLRTKVGPEVQSKIDDMISSGVISGLSDVSDDQEIGNQAKATMEDVSATIVSAASAIKDIHKGIKELLASPNARQRLRAVIKEFMTGSISKGLVDKWGHVRPEVLYGAAANIQQNFIDPLQQTFDAMDPVSAAKYATAQVTKFNQEFKDALPDKVPEEMRQKLWDYVTLIYGTAGIPIPQKIKDQIWGKGAQIPDEFGKGVNNQGDKPKLNKAGDDLVSDVETHLRPKTAYDKGKQNTSEFNRGLDAPSGIHRTVESIKTDVAHMNDHGKGGKRSDAYSWGVHLGHNLASGILKTEREAYNAAKALANAIHRVLHQTTADEGPLKDTDVWGLHLGQNIADGITASIPSVARSASNLAQAVSDSYNVATSEVGRNGVSVESSALRTVKVLVEVTSPDGSVDRVKASQLESALMTNDLILSLEHFATVG